MVKIVVQLAALLVITQQALVVVPTTPTGGVHAMATPAVEVVHVQKLELATINATLDGTTVMLMHQMDVRLRRIAVDTKRTS